MAATVTKLRALLARRAGAWVKLADPTEALAYALGSVSITPADPDALVDADVSAVSAVQEGQVLDVAEWKVLEAALNNCDDASLQSVGITMSARDAAAMLQRRVDQLYLRVSRMYGVGVGTMTAGVINVDIAAKGDDAWPTGTGY